MTTARNAACPCGSGKKYKRCCGADLEASDLSTDEVSSSGVAEVSPKSGKLLPLCLFSGAIAAGVAVGTLRGAVADGLAVALALVMGVVIYLMARNPPEGTGKDGGAAINFGLDTRGKRRGRSAQNRRQRRRR